MKSKIFSLPVFFITIVVLMVFSSFSSSQSLEVSEPCLTKNWTFKDGEELTYKIFYNWNFIWLNAGEVVFKITEENDSYHYSAKGRTYGSYEWFFKVRDNYDTWVDKETLLPKVAIRDVHEGGYKLYEKSIFDQETHRVVTYRGENKDKTTKAEFKLKDCMNDMVSIIYQIRNQQFQSMSKNAQVPISVFLDQEVYPLNVLFKGRYKKLVVKESGTYNAYKFVPQVVAGEVFKEGTEMSVWVSDDKNQIPVFIESPVSVGSVKVILKNQKGLRYPFDAKTK